MLIPPIFPQERPQIVLDGERVSVLRIIENHSSIPLEELKDLVMRQLSSPDAFHTILDSLSDSKLVYKDDQTISMTPEGALWLEKFRVEMTVEEEDPSSDGTPNEPYEVSKLKMEAKHLSVFQALRKIEKKEIDLRPEFQRAFVWDIVRQSRLIESLLIRIPLPAFYLDATDQINWSVVDGLQRLTTLYKYCREESFALKGLQFLHELEGKTFTELPPQYKVLVEDDTQLLFYNLMPGTPVQAKFTIFSRVNTGGMQLTTQEIRHALNQGKVTDTLGIVASNPKFKKATSGVVESLRMSDRELILRALAFMHINYSEYRIYNEQDAFLLHAMAELNSCTDDVLSILSEEFLSSLEKVEAIFGRYAYRKYSQLNGRRSPFNKALFEVWTVSVNPYSLGELILKRDEIVKEFLGLLNTASFSRSISSSTGSSTAVATRFYGIEQLLKRIMR